MTNYETIMTHSRKLYAANMRTSLLWFCGRWHYKSEGLDI